MSGDERATKKPDRGEYPDADVDDFVRAVERAASDEGWSHHVVGRYTATRTYTELNPASRPGDKTVVVRVEACERDVIADIPEDSVDEFLHGITSFRNG